MNDPYVQWLREKHEIDVRFIKTYTVIGSTSFVVFVVLLLWAYRVLPVWAIAAISVTSLMGTASLVAALIIWLSIRKG